MHLRPRGRRGASTSPRCPTARSRCLPLHRPSSTAARRPDAGRAGARGTARRATRCRSTTWRRMMAHHYPGGGWVRLRRDTLDALRSAQGRARACRRSTRRVAELLEEEAMSERLDELVDSLLYEGYALYPYTPGATKNATPTPFGIVYPPAYAEARRTFDHLRMECALEAEGGRRSRRRCASCRPGRAPPGASERRVERRRARARRCSSTSTAVRGPRRGCGVEPAGRRAPRVRVCEQNTTRSTTARRAARRGAASEPAVDPRVLRTDGGRVRLAAGAPRAATASTPGRCSRRRTTT